MATWRFAAALVVLAAVAGVCGATALTFSAAAQTAPQAPAVEVVLSRAAEYVDRFADALSNVVAEEHYSQDVSTGGRLLGRRVLRSDILLLKVGGPLEWRPYRDVFEVDGKPVRDRDDRLIALFERPSATSFEQAVRIARESARFNIGLASRTINTPVLTLLFLQRGIQPRFRFKLGKLERDRDTTLRVVEFHEEARPTLIRGLLLQDTTDLPAAGKAWLDEETGRVAKIDAEFAALNMDASLETTFRRDETLGVDVPATMRELYRLERSVQDYGSVSRQAGAPRAVRITQVTIVKGQATYSRFRQFSVTADEAIRRAP